MDDDDGYEREQEEIGEDLATLDPYDDPDPPGDD